MVGPYTRRGTVEMIAMAAMIDQLPITLIEMLVTIGETKNFTEAAQRLGIAKATVSRGVTRLEELLGEPLVRRNSHRVELTALGRIVFEQATPSITSLRSLRDSLPRPEDDRVAGAIRVVAAYDVVVEILPPIVDAFTRAFPDVTVAVTASDRATDPITERADLAIQSGCVDRIALSPHELVRASFRAYAEPGYVAKHGTPRGIQDDGHRWVVKHQVTGGVPTCARVVVTDYVTVMRFLSRGGAIGFLPSYLGDPAVARGELSEIAVPGFEPPSGYLFAVVLSARPTPPRITKFLEHLVEATRHQRAG